MRLYKISILFIFAFFSVFTFRNFSHAEQKSFVRQTWQINLGDSFVVPGYAHLKNECPNNELNENGDRDYGGYYNFYSFPYQNTFLAIKNSKILCWGSSVCDNSPKDSGYVKAFSNPYGFAALKSNGAVTIWGDKEKYTYSSSRDISGQGYTKIVASGDSFTALKSDGSLRCYSFDRDGVCNRVPTDKGYIKIYSNEKAFAALKADGSINTWGDSRFGGTGAPTDKGYIKIYSNEKAFAALKADGSINTWGDSRFGGTGAPTDKGYIKIYSNEKAFAALKADGSINTWGDSRFGGTGAPTDKGYTKITSSKDTFIALKTDGSISCWGSSCENVPIYNDNKDIYSNSSAFASLKEDGSMVFWKKNSRTRFGKSPNVKVKSVYSSETAFSVLDENGGVHCFNLKYGKGDTEACEKAPQDMGYINIYSSRDGFIGIKSDGSVSCWGQGSCPSRVESVEKSVSNNLGNRKGVCVGSLAKDGPKAYFPDGAKLDTKRKSYVHSYPKFDEVYLASHQNRRLGRRGLLWPISFHDIGDARVDVSFLKEVGYASDFPLFDRYCNGAKVKRDSRGVPVSGYYKGCYVNLKVSSSIFSNNSFTPVENFKFEEETYHEILPEINEFKDEVGYYNIVYNYDFDKSRWVSYKIKELKSKKVHSTKAILIHDVNLIGKVKTYSGGKKDVYFNCYGLFKDNKEACMEHSTSNKKTSCWWVPAKESVVDSNKYQDETKDASNQEDLNTDLNEEFPISQDDVYREEFLLRYGLDSLEKEGNTAKKNFYQFYNDKYGEDDPIESPQVNRGNSPVPIIPGGKKCESKKIITQNLRRGDRDGKYSSYAKASIYQVSLLQEHMNRILKDEYGDKASGPVDGVFGPLTERGVRRLQRRLNQLLPKMKPLRIDGIVGPFTRAAINYSC